MRKSWRLGRLFGFPIEINLSFLLLLALVFVAFGGVAGVIVTCIAFASVVLHELGHAVVARRLGVHVAGIELSFLGGAAKLTQLPRSADHEIAIAAAGPAVSLMLAGLGLGLGAALHVPLLATIGWINLVLAAFNLIPALPMDGGRILRALLTRKVSFVRATDIAVQVSRVAAVGFAILGLLGAYQLLVLAPMLWLMGSRERLMAHAMPAPYAGAGGRHDRGGGGGGGFGAGPSRGPFSGGPFSGGPFSGGPSGGALFGSSPSGAGPTRGGTFGGRFTIRQVGGRFVIEAIE